MSKLLWSILIVILIVFFSVAYKNTLVSKTIFQNVNKTDYQIKNFNVSEIPQKNDDIVDPKIYAKASYLIDMDSAYPMYANNEKLELPIASTTKITTAIVVLDNYSDHLNDVVTITKDMIDVEPSVINLKVGENITVKNLLEGMLIKSGNDAAYSLADYFGGRTQFVAEMNQKIAQLGLTDTHYEDPAGLNDQGYSTARDLAMISTYAFKHDEFRQIIINAQKTISSIDGGVVHELVSTDRLIIPTEQYYYDKSIGGKTGFTNEAGYVLVSVAEDNGHKILSVVLNTDEKTLYASAKESKKLLEWGFDNWHWL